MVLNASKYNIDGGNYPIRWAMFPRRRSEQSPTSKPEQPRETLNELPCLPFLFPLSFGGRTKYLRQTVSDISLNTDHISRNSQRASSLASMPSKPLGTGICHISHVLRRCRLGQVSTGHNLYSMLLSGHKDATGSRCMTLPDCQASAATSAVFRSTA